ncbi:MAG TPA: M20/M25/M40 family metallo-hydrolase [Bacteroidales bacterium]|nr:M20/M25/M40 family metallo-hydrolase [Bacteroidales bacterium]
MNRKRSLITIPVILLILTACSPNPGSQPGITIEELAGHVNYLASDKLEGRLPGSEGDMLAAKYIRDQLVSNGLKPMVGKGLQEFEIVASVVPGDNNNISLNSSEPEIGTDYMPMAFSDNNAAEGEVVFVGYGFEIENDTLSWNDYAGFDVTGKIVMILRADPEVDNNMSGFASFSMDRDKCMLAKDKGASAVLLVSGEKFDPADEFESLAKGEHSVGIPVFRIKRTLADEILLAENSKITSLESEFNEFRKPNSFNTGATISCRSHLQQEILTARNVVMKLEGNDPELKNEYVIVGGHYDHLGLGGPGSSSRAQDTTGVHYGADDNASGISSMLEIAEKAASEGSNARTIIFTAFAAEEMGLLGSRYLVENMWIDPAKVNAMINLDMVGRLKETNVLQIGGVGTAEQFNKIIMWHADTNLFTLALSEEGFGPSDHSSFYGKDIPVLFFSTGAHLDYHTPFDSLDKLNYEGLLAISDLVYDITGYLANDTERLVFSEAGPRAQVTRGMRRKGVTLGIMPDFAGNVEDGLRADFVIPGRPADLGGMMKGDVITAINGLAVNNIQDYMFRLSKLSQGETISVEVLRNDKKEVLLITLQ